MRFWQKIFLGGYMVLFLAFNAIGILWLSRDYSDMIKRENSFALLSHQSFQQSLYTSFVYWKNQLGNSPDIYKVYQSDIILKLTQTRDNSRQIMVTNSNNQIIFSNTDDSVRNHIEQTMNKLDRDISYGTYKLDKDMVIITGNNFKVGEDYFNLYTINYITEEYNYQNETRHISEGYYSTRIPLAGNDEISHLTSQINVMAEAIDNREKDLKNIAKQRQRFVENFTHELKTPLTSIIAYADLMRTVKQEPYEMDEGLNYISSEGKRLSVMSQKLMNMFHLKSGELELKLTPLNIIFEQVYNILKLRLKEKNIVIKFHCDDISLNIERELFKTLLTNLLDNAIKASTAGDEIYLTAREQDNKIIIEIVDKGFGIPEKELSYIMEPFYMVDKARTRKHNGAGLGLSLCHKIVVLHNAVINIKSKEGEGTCVSIIFEKGSNGNETELQKKNNLL
ncbi:HAMP domain-containing sensor histidine kinase [Clostridium sp.]|uniref:sensor histidine kinase n=1 Tax=Clostridium sp. TaxID=1506 RepID=UPI002586DA34|nr:HAMP domain-containing sensor histidine kinase [Clostridium sp.]MDF2504709.1 signal transduction histidine kinase [Clostridium sp.]